MFNEFNLCSLDGRWKAFSSMNPCGWNHPNPNVWESQGNNPTKGRKRWTTFKQPFSGDFLCGDVRKLEVHPWHEQKNGKTHPVVDLNIKHYQTTDTILQYNEPWLWNVLLVLWLCKFGVCSWCIINLQEYLAATVGAANLWNLFQVELPPVEAKQKLWRPLGDRDLLGHWLLRGKSNIW